MTRRSTLPAAVLALAGFASLAPAVAAQSADLPYDRHLLTQLDDERPAFRVEAARSIAKMGPDAKGAVPALVKRLGDASAEVRAALLDALGEIGVGSKPAVPQIGKALAGDAEAAVRASAARALGKIGAMASRATGDLLRAFQREGDGAVREAAAEALVRVSPRGPETLQAFQEALSGDDASRRIVAATQLGRLGAIARPALPALEALVNDADAALAEAADLAIRRIGGEVDDSGPAPDAIAEADLPVWKSFSLDDLFGFLGSEAASTRQKSALQLGRRAADLGPRLRAASTALVAMLRKDAEPSVRVAAAHALGRLGAECPDLGRALTDEELSVRVAAARAIGALGRRAGAAAAPLALARIADDASIVRKVAGEALASIDADVRAMRDEAKSAADTKTAERIAGDLAQRIVGTLTDGLARKDEDVRMRATLAVAELGPAAKGAVTRLVGLLRDPFGFVRAGAASALASIGADAGAEAVAALERAIVDDDPRVRGRIRDALALLAPESPALPPPAPAVPPTPVAPPAAEAPPAAPEAEAPRPLPPPGSLAEAVERILAGEGGITRPTASVEGDDVSLDLRLEHERFDEEMGHGDAVRFTIKLFRGIPELKSLRIVFRAHRGRQLGRYVVTRASAEAYFEKFDDPFESRRLREWWPRMARRG